MHARPLPALLLTILAVPAAADTAEEVVTVKVHSHAPDESETVGVAVSVGAGVSGFAEGDLRQSTDIGLAWDARITFGTERTLALELAYIGSVQQTDLIVPDTTLVGHGAEATARVNLTTSQTQPYIVGGIGWVNYQLYRNNSRVTIPADDDALTVPLGGGVTVPMGSAFFDLRGVYRLAFDDESFRRQSGFVASQGLDSWAFTARVGYPF